MVYMSLKPAKISKQGFYSARPDARIVLTVSMPLDTCGSIVPVVNCITRLNTLMHIAVDLFFVAAGFTFGVMTNKDRLTKWDAVRDLPCCTIKRD